MGASLGRRGPGLGILIALGAVALAAPAGADESDPFRNNFV